VQRASGVPHALFGRTIQQSLGRTARRGREVVSGIPRHCERSEAIHSSVTRRDGLLRSARNDDSQLNWLFETLNPWQFIEHERASVLDTPLSRSMTIGIYFGCLKFESES
jgi:hypothetical protein